MDRAPIPGSSSSRSSPRHSQSGPDFCFGGNCGDLRQFSRTHTRRMIVPDPVTLEGHGVGSSRSRRSIGALGAAATDGSCGSSGSLRSRRLKRRRDTSTTRSRVSGRPHAAVGSARAASGAIVGTTRYHDIVAGDRSRGDRLHLVRRALAAHARQHRVQAAAARARVRDARVPGRRLRTDNFNFASQRAIAALGAQAGRRAPSSSGAARRNGARLA